MSIQTIIRKAIKRIELEGNTLTPDFYAEAFCKEASRAGKLIEDCAGITKFTSSLHKEFQKDLKDYRVKTRAELIRFLIARLNKTVLKYNDDEIARLSQLLMASFTPSIAPKDHKDLIKITKKINNNPAIIEKENIKNEIKSAIALRMALDKKSVKEMMKSLDGVMDKISLRLIKLIEVSDASNSNLSSIKKELEEYPKLAHDDFKQAHNKLYNITVSLEENTRALSKDLKEHSSELEKMNLKVKKLEQELESAKKDSKEDFLTKLYNKRALDEFFEFKEAEYKRYAYNYSIVMFDLDFFKSVNDTYGHDTGDLVLKSLARILKKEVRTEDIVGRFGGEEFVAILSGTDTKGAIVFAEKVRKNVEKARFMHKKDRINITISCGVSERGKHTSLQEVFVSADENLYKAKEGGRNRVEA